MWLNVRAVLLQLVILVASIVPHIYDIYCYESSFQHIFLMLGGCSWIKKPQMVGYHSVTRYSIYHRIGNRKWFIKASLVGLRFLL